ncbi:MAG: exodeoxyribonuclease VII large subunit, partial [Hyphomicrobium sp.]
TPTKAAEWAVPKYSELIDALEKFGLRQRMGMRRVLESVRTHLKAAGRGLPKLEDLIALPRQRFDAADRRLGRALLANTRAHGTRLARTGGRLSTAPLVQRLSRSAERLAALYDRSGQALMHRITVRRRVLEGRAAVLGALGYQGVLARGYALVRGDDGRMIRSAGVIAPGNILAIEFVDGQILAEAKSGSHPGAGATGTSQGSPKSGGKAEPQIGKASRSPSGSRGGQGSLF